MRPILIGLGHRARQGKDWLGEYLSKNINFMSIVMHFADGLYEECTNAKYKDKHPAVIKKDDFLSFFVNEKDHMYMALPKEEVMDLYNWMTVNGLDQIDGMTDKNPILLQAWGTNLRRKYYGDDYWVRSLNLRLQAKLAEYSHFANPIFVFIPDTRFLNEVKFIKSTGGYYIEVQRFNDDGSRYYDPSRNPEHPSEKELDEFADNKEYSYIVKATSGDIKNLIESGMDIFNDIVRLEKLKQQSTEAA